MDDVETFFHVFNADARSAAILLFAMLVQTVFYGENELVIANLHLVSDEGGFAVRYAMFVGILEQRYKQQWWHFNTGDGLRIGNLHLCVGRQAQLH